jgi:hypothetical protein
MTKYNETMIIIQKRLSVEGTLEGEFATRKDHRGFVILPHGL